MPTIWLVLLSSTAREVVHDPAEPSGEVATHTRVAATTFTSNGPKTDAPQPPAASALRVPHTAYTWPVFWLTKMLEGPPESEH